MEAAASVQGSREEAGAPDIRVMVLGLRGLVRVEGGIETHARKLYPLLARMGCRVEVLQRSPYYPKSARPRSWHGVRLRYLWSPVRPGLETAVHTFLGVLYAAVTRPDILHLHAIGPGFLAPLARALGLRVVVTHHAEDYRREKWGRLARLVLQCGERLGMRFAHRPIVVSAVLKEAVNARHGVEARVIPNGAPRTLRVATTRALEDLGLAPGRYVMCVARLEPTKRQLDLVDAFQRAELPGWKLVLVGSIDRQSAYAAALAERAAADSRIVLAGFRSGKALQELYSHCGLFVLPSSMEGHPIALLEAISYGVPVLASAIPEHLALPLPQGSLFPLGDTEALAALMRRTGAGAPPDRDRTRQLVRERYSWRRAAQLTRSVYTDALGS